MKVLCYDAEFDIPDLAIDKYIKDFECLPGSGDRESVLQLRNAVDDVLDYIAEDPELLNEKDYLSDFVKAMAMQQALGELGILYDA
jgi:hypothetical protein